MYADLNVEDLDSLIEALQDAGVDSVGYDPAQLNLPGVWVNLTELEPFTLQGLRIRLELIVLAPNTEPRYALAALQPVFNQVLDAITPKPFSGPSGPALTGVWSFGESKTRYPGIAVPLELLTQQETLP